MKLTLITQTIDVSLHPNSNADPERGGGGGGGGSGGPEGEDYRGPDTPQGPLENHKLYGFLGISNWNPWKKLDPLFNLGK